MCHEILEEMKKILGLRIERAEHAAITLAAHRAAGGMCRMRRNYSHAEGIRVVPRAVAGG